MNKEDILNILKKYNFDTNQYMVISSSAMVLLGIKDTANDIDISVTHPYNSYLLDNFNCKFYKKNKYNEDVFYIDNIINFSTSYYCNNYTLVNGIKVQSIDDILKMKYSLNREKDILDIKLLEGYKNE